MQPAVFLTFFRALVTFFEVTITKHFTGFFFFSGGAFTCEGCGRIFTSLNFMQRHMKHYCLTRTTNRTWDCKKCSKRFASMHYLKIHVCIDSKEHPLQKIKKKKKLVVITDSPILTQRKNRISVHNVTRRLSSQVI